MPMRSRTQTFTNGHYELPAHARGVLVLADPPEAGWRIQGPSNERPRAVCGSVAATGREGDGPRATHTPVVANEER
jgi:hypothetical protein